MTYSTDTPLLYPDTAEPNRIGCRCSYPECRADACLHCAEDRMIMRPLFHKILNAKTRRTGVLSPT